MPRDEKTLDSHIAKLSLSSSKSGSASTGLQGMAEEHAESQQAAGELPQDDGGDWQPVESQKSKKARRSGKGISTLAVPKGDPVYQPGGGSTASNTPQVNGNFHFNRPKLYGRDDYRQGMIIRSNLHEPGYTGKSKISINTDADTENKSKSNYGTVYSKSRRMIVISLFEEHYVAIPLYTHNHRGLERKNAPDEYISVIDHRTPRRGPPTQLSKHFPLETETLIEGVDRFDPMCTAHITYAIPRRYDNPVIFEGTLKKSSVNALINLYKEFAPPLLTDRSGKPIK
ncbi:MAG: hypothetical protein Q9183_002772 [Haloplaca sp. 2 TL-2023]